MKEKNNRVKQYLREFKYEDRKILIEVCENNLIYLHAKKIENLLDEDIENVSVNALSTLNKNIQEMRRVNHIIHSNDDSWQEEAKKVVAYLPANWMELELEENND